jgi:UDPglucose 6-dehydrogenase
VKISIFGTGYVGLVSAVCLADLGHEVIGVDKNPEVVARLAEGVPTIYEPGLHKRLSANLAANRLRFTTRPEDAMQGSDIVFLCVGTPPRSDGSADLGQVEEVARSIAPLLNGYTLIVEKSTVPVNTAYWIDRMMRRFAQPGHEFDVASNPEFLREGSAIRDFLQPDRIVIGADSERARSLLERLYRSGFDCPVLVTDVKTAELIKHAANAFLAAKVSFVNLVADLCEQVGVDVAMVAKGIGLDPRIGDQFLDAGLGYGGSCFPKDIKALIRMAEERGVNVGLLREVERINDDRVGRLLKKVERALGVVHGKAIGVLGLAFKPETDDIREAPSLKVVPALLEAGATLRAYDPRAGRNFERLYSPGKRLSYVGSVEDAARDASALVILTDWQEFRSLDFERLRAVMATPIVIDGRNLFSPAEIESRGFEYYSLGRGDVTNALALTAAGIGDVAFEEHVTR